MPRHPDRRRLRRGFTMLELLVALAITGLVLVGGHLMINQIEDAGRTLARDAREADRRANGERLMRALIGRVEATGDSTRPFLGTAETAAFESWCEQPGGWLERCRVTLTLAAHEDSSAMTAIYPGGETVRLRTFPGAASFRYVARDSAGTRWLDAWGRGITVPFALVVVHAADSVVVVIGSRG